MPIDTRQLAQKALSVLRSDRGRGVLTFCVFLIISAILWFVLSLNDEMQAEYKLPTELVDLPSDVTIISSVPSEVSVSLKDKGNTLLKYQWGKPPTLKLKYSDFSRSGNHLTLSQIQMQSAIRSAFGGSVNIMSMRPDSLRLEFTTNRGRLVKVTIDADVHTLPQYIAHGHPILLTDTVLLYSNLPGRKSVKSISTEPIALSNLSDTTEVEVGLIVPEGMRAVPSTVKVRIPVEPLVSKTRQIPIEVANDKGHHHIVAFPSTIELSYLLPKSLYGLDSYAAKAFVDYNDIRAGKRELPVTLSILPDYYKSVRINPQTVQYVVEKVND